MKKQCKDCKLEGVGPQPLECFGKMRSSTDGHQRICKKHMHIRGNAWYAAHKDKVKDRYAKLVAKRSGVELDVVRKVLASMKHFPHGTSPGRKLGSLHISDAMKGWGVACA